MAAMGVGLACLVIWTSMTPLGVLWRVGGPLAGFALAHWAGSRGVSQKAILWTFAAALAIALACLVIWTPTTPLEALASAGVALTVVALLFWAFLRAAAGTITLWQKLRGRSFHQ